MHFCVFKMHTRKFDMSLTGKDDPDPAPKAPEVFFSEVKCKGNDFVTLS